MTAIAHFKRYVFLVHRWTGVAMCLLMAIWFASGMVMLFVGYPKLTPQERLANLQPLPLQGCCVPSEHALAHSRRPAEVKGLVLTSIAGRPFYVLTEGDGKRLAVDAATGAAQAPAGRERALAGARAFMPGAGARYAGLVTEDRWTHSRALDPHRPLHVVDMQDSAATRLYLSSATGQVVLDAPRAQRLWNFAGAWLHWLYMVRNSPVDPVWSWTVIILSGIGTLSAFTGALNGIWRWRFTGRYGNGTRTPFREDWLRWHHIIGLVFGAILFAWIFSGLMSMNPFGVFDARGRKPDQGAYNGGHPGVLRPDIGAPAALALLRERGFEASELEWRVLAGQPYLLARDNGGATRLIARTDSGHVILRRWPDTALLGAGRRLLRAPIAHSQVLDRYDAYYYRREVPSMYGADERRLPVLRLVFADAGASWVHLDPATGDMVSAMDRSQRVGRWLFNFLHSWDLPVMLDARTWRQAILLALGAGGLLFSATAVVLGLRRLRLRLGKMR